MHTAQLVCNTDPNVSSDIKSAPTVAAAKQAARDNYQAKYNANPNWQNHWHTFDALLAASSFKTT
jgi:hypothetical protein